MLTATKQRSARVLLPWTLARAWNLVYVVPAIVLLLIVRAVLPDVFNPPQLLSALPVEAPTSAALSVLLAMLVVASAAEPCPAVHSIASTRRRLLPLLRVSVLVIGIVATSATFGAWLTAANSMLSLVGEALLAATVVGVRYSWTLPLVHGTTAALFGTDAFGHLSSWAWPLATEPSGIEMTLSLAIFVAGLLAIARRPSVSAD